MKIGEKIQQLRQAQKMTMSELAAKSSVQLATLSRIENHKMTGTLECHSKIAQALGISIVDLYRDITIKDKKASSPLPQLPQTQSSLRSPEFFIHSEKSTHELLTASVLAKKMMPTMLKLEPGGKTTPEQNQTGSEKFIFVLEGNVEVTVDGKSYSLAKNSTLYFDSSLPYYMANNGKTSARVLCVGTPVSL